MDWYGADGDVGGVNLHEVVETDAFGNAATYTPADGGPTEQITGTLEQSSQRLDELLPELGMSLAAQVFRVRRAVKRESDFPRSTDTDSMFFGRLDVAGTEYDITAVVEDQSYVYLALATAV